MNLYGFVFLLFIVGTRGQFEVEFQWTHLNYTWESEDAYNDALQSGVYVPLNNALAGIKFFQDRLFLAMPRVCPGTPVTLGYVSTAEDADRVNPLITPFPDWTSHNLSLDSCETLINVQSMEIDSDGILWVIDGFRGSFIDTDCPPKILLYDLNNDGRLIQSYDFPNEICLTKGGFLNDLVIDSTDGGYAYITDHGTIDPGVIVYSKEQNRAWKLRDPSMFTELENSVFQVGEIVSTGDNPIDGIALDALGTPNRQLYYSSVAGLGLHSISSDILKDEGFVNSGQWRFNVTHIGDKPSQSDGMVADNSGVLYYGLMTLYGVGAWDTNQDFSTNSIIDSNNETMIWTDSFAFDDDGNLYLLTNHINEFFGTDCTFDITGQSKFRVLRYHTGTKSYLYELDTN